MTPILDDLWLRDLLEYEVRCRIERSDRNPPAFVTKRSRFLSEHGAPEGCLTLNVVYIQYYPGGLQDNAITGRRWPPILRINSASHRIP